VQNAPHTRLKAGLDIQGGARALVEPDQKLTDQQLQDLIAVSNNRFNVFGLSEVKKMVSVALNNIVGRSLDSIVLAGC
jgi:preprotein translocase subunit SecD